MRWLIGTVVITILIGIVVLFTPIGNAVLKPFIEAKIQKSLAADARLKTFSLNFSQVDIVIDMAEQSRIKLSGEYNLFSQQINMTYHVDITDLSNVRKVFSSKPLQGPLHTHGTMTGEISHMQIQGEGHLVDSHLKYTAEVEDFDVERLNAHGNLTLQEVLHLFIQPKIADAKVAVDVNMTSMNSEDLIHSNGELVVAIREGVVDTEVLQQQYNIALKPTPFQVDTTIKLDRESVELLFDAQLAHKSHVASQLSIDLDSQGVVGRYDVAFEDLGIASLLAGRTLQGPLSSSGTISGDLRQTTIEGDAAIEVTKLHYSLFLEKLKAKRAKLNGNVALHEVLHLVALPIYARADMSVLIAMNSLNIKALSGVMKTTVNRGTLNSVLLQRDFNISLPLTAFTADIDTQLKKSVAISTVEVISGIASLWTKETVWNLKTQTLQSDYVAVIDDLNRLHFITKRPLRGAVAFYGDIKYHGTDFEMTAHSAVLGGELDATMLNNKISTVIKGFQTVELSNMLVLPKIFDSTMNATVDYDIISKQGIVKAMLLKGRILPTEMSSLLHQMAHFDMTKELYDTTELNSTIENMQILTDLSMKGRLSNITASGALLDLEHNRIDARLDIMLKHYPVPILVQGDINAPHIGIDAKALLQGEGKEKLKEVIDTKLGDKLSPEAKELLKGLFN